MVTKSPKNPLFLLVILGIFFVAGILFFNSWLQKEMADFESRHQPPVVKKKAEKKSGPASRPDIVKGKIVRKMKMDPSRKYAMSRIFLDGEQIASFRSVGEKVYDYQGDLVEGKIEFVNETADTYGYEYYSRGKRHGSYKEFYEDGSLRREAQYANGKLIENKVYFINGQLRMYQNFRDALISTNDIEAGEGKIYYRDGTLMYEWNLTNRLNGGYKRAYNVKGQLVEERLYNEFGEMTEIKKY